MFYYNSLDSPKHHLIQLILLKTEHSIIRLIGLDKQNYIHGVLNVNVECNYLCIDTFVFIA